MCFSKFNKKQRFYKKRPSSKRHRPKLPNQETNHTSFFFSTYIIYLRPFNEAYHEKIPISLPLLRKLCQLPHLSSKSKDHHTYRKGKLDLTHPKTYAENKPPNNITSDAKNNHIPSFALYNPVSGLNFSNFISVFFYD